MKKLAYSVSLHGIYRIQLTLAGLQPAHPKSPPFYFTNVEGIELLECVGYLTPRLERLLLKIGIWSKMELCLECGNRRCLLKEPFSLKTTLNYNIFVRNWGILIIEVPYFSIFKDEFNGVYCIYIYRIL